MSSARSTRSRTRRPREPLSRDRVVEGAIGLLDAHGLPALTMRRLAGELGVEAMTLYYHVGSKDELIVAAVDHVFGEVQLDPPERGWKARLRTIGLSTFDALSRHPWAASAMLSMDGTSPRRLQAMNALLGELADAGFDAHGIDHAYHVIEGHVVGFALWVAGMNLPDRPGLERVARDFLAQLPPDLPHVADHVRHHLEPPRPGDEGSFAFGLDLILDGLERKAPESRA